MTAHASSFAPNIVVLDPAQLVDGVQRIFKKGFPEPILVLKADGSILSGNGSVPPVLVSGGAATTYIISGSALPNVSEVATSNVAGASNTQVLAFGSVSAAAPSIASVGGLAGEVNVVSDGVTAEATLMAGGVSIVDVSSDGVTPKLGFFAKAPVARPSAIAPATDAGSAITQLNLLIAAVKAVGITA